VLERLGQRHEPTSRARMARGALRPSILAGAAIAVPLFGRIARNVKAMGLDEQRLYRSLARFNAAGERSPTVARNPAYRIISTQTRAAVEHGPGHERLIDVLIAASDHYPRRWLRDTPVWIDQLTHEPAA